MTGTNLRAGGNAWTRTIRVGLQSAAMGVAVCLVTTIPAAAQADLGTWLNTDRKGKIVLSECGDQSLCGKLVWLKDPLDEKGKPWRDILNPDPVLRRRQVVGIDVLIGTKKIGPNTWQGQIYDPEVGKVYYLKHLKLGQDRVEIKGCLSSGWPCRTKYWTKSQPVRPPAPTMQVANRQTGAPKPPPAPPVAAQVPPPVAVAPPAPVPPPAQARAPYRPPQPNRPQARPPAPPRPATAPPSAPQVTASIPRSGGYLVQVAARQSQNEALRAFNDLQRRYPRLLGGIRPQVLRADLGQRGIWYRVGIGPMAQQSAATNFCQQLKSAGADCFIRRR